MALTGTRKMEYNPITHRWENHGSESQWAKNQKRKEESAKKREWLNTPEGKKWVQDKKDRGEWV